jgi:hypothetical protein
LQLWFCCVCSWLCKSYNFSQPLSTVTSPSAVSCLRLTVWRGDTITKPSLLRTGTSQTESSGSPIPELTHFSVAYPECDSNTCCMIYWSAERLVYCCSSATHSLVPGFNQVWLFSLRFQSSEDSHSRQTVKYGHESSGTQNQESPCWRGPGAIWSLVSQSVSQWWEWHETLKVLITVRQ